MKEIWKAIEGYEGYFEVSNLGRVKSVERRVKQGNTSRYVREHFKKLHIGAYGYPSVTLCKNGKSVDIPIHRLLAKAFIPNPEGKPAIDHINTDRTDYRLENLRWVSYKENANNILTLKHCRENTYTENIIKKRLETRKERQTATAPKTVFQYSKEGVLIKEFYSMSEAERITGINHNSIHRALNDCTQSAGGFIWTNTIMNNLKYSRKYPPSSKTVEMYDRMGNFINSWKSVNEASRCLGIPTANITRSIKSNKIPRKYKFKYKEGA